MQIKQLIVQIYFAIRHTFYESRKIIIRLFFSKKFTHSLDANQLKLFNDIKEYGCGSINYKLLLNKTQQFESLIKRANELLKSQDELNAVTKKITIKQKKFKVTVTSLFNHRDLKCILSDKNLIEIVRVYFQNEAYINQSSVWWDRSLGNSPRDSQKYHFDGEDPIMLKVFFYLTDVSVKDGPFMFIKKSNKYRTKFNLILRHGIHDIEDNDLSSYTLSNAEQFIGKAGKVIFADTNGFHKGGIVSPSSSGRILFTLTFVSKWPTSDKPPGQIVPFISGKDLMSANYLK
jgi:hypothetical protein